MVSAVKNIRLRPPRLRYVTQDYDGRITWRTKPPRKACVWWDSDGAKVDYEGYTAPNIKWQEANIDLDAVKNKEYDYELTDGILRKIPAKERKNDENTNSNTGTARHRNT